VQTIFIVEMIIYSVIMLITGYFGEVVYGYGCWGFVSGAAYFAIVYEIWLGSASKLAAQLEEKY
jgi:hypothetical protein